MVKRVTVSIMQACELVGVSRRTIYNWINASKLEYIRTAGGGVRIYTDTLFREANGDKLGVRHEPLTAKSGDLTHGPLIPNGRAF